MLDIHTRCYARMCCVSGRGSPTQWLYLCSCLLKNVILYSNSVSCHPPGDLPDPGIEPMSLTSPAVAGRFFTTSTTWEAQVQFSSVSQLCLTLCNTMNCSTPGLPVHHQLPEFTQTHLHRVGDAIQPSHPLSAPSPPAPNPSQHQSLFQ